MTDYSKLLEAGRIKRGQFSRAQVEDCLQIAERDIETAATVLAASPEWAFNIAYNAMHQAGRAFLFYCGYRTTGLAHHATVVRFLELSLGREREEIVAAMDRMRRKRNRATYKRVGTITKNEATEAISAARELTVDVVQRVGRAGH